MPFDSAGLHNITLLDKTTEHLKQNEILWSKRKSRYRNSNDYLKITTKYKFVILNWL